MHKMFLLAFLIGWTATATAQPVVWHRYAVPETGSNVDLPVTIFVKDAGPTNLGYGRRFKTADGRATLAVQSIDNVGHDTPGTFLAKKHPPSTIAYKRVTDNFSPTRRGTARS